MHSPISLYSLRSQNHIPFIHIHIYIPTNIYNLISFKSIYSLYHPFHPYLSSSHTSSKSTCTLTPFSPITLQISFNFFCPPSTLPARPFPCLSHFSIAFSLPFRSFPFPPPPASPA